MRYSEKMQEHFTSPRNVGAMDKDASDVGTGVVGSPACGDVMQFQIRVDDTGRIADAKFKTFGCGAAIASSSYLTELIKGKTLDEARAVRNGDIACELELPEIKIHCSVLAEDAVKAAIEDWQGKHPDGTGAATADAGEKPGREL